MNRLIWIVALSLRSTSSLWLFAVSKCRGSSRPARLHAFGQNIFFLHQILREGLSVEVDLFQKWKSATHRHEIAMFSDSAVLATMCLLPSVVFLFVLHLCLCMDNMQLAVIQGNKLQWHALQRRAEPQWNLLWECAIQKTEERYTLTWLSGSEPWRPHL